MKNEKGITIVALVLTVILMIIISSTIIYNVRKSTNVEKYNNLCADIQLLEDKIAVYYNKYGQIPTKGESIAPGLIMPSIMNKESDPYSLYYQIDIEKLQNVSLSLSNDTDQYIINATSHKVYFQKGLEFDGDIYYCKNL